ncbi:hypothetical protein KSS87_011856 [Heliosperma pusillum]|nr:hypothetical protein KSS87_011856 [Heliosperma pusillum]
MATTEEKAQGSQQVDGSDPAIGFAGKVEAKYRELKENAETYPYVWASYVAVYGGFGLWTLYRWRKLRKTEDRVRALQERLRQLVQDEESATAASKSATSVDTASTSAHVSKPPK